MGPIQLSPIFVGVTSAVIAGVILCILNPYIKKIVPNISSLPSNRRKYRNVAKVACVIGIVIAGVFFFKPDSPPIPPPIPKPVVVEHVFVDAKKNASTVKLEGWKKGVRLRLAAGTWQVKPDGGGWSAWESDDLAPKKQRGAWTWNVQIFVNAHGYDGESFCYGMCGKDWWMAKSKGEADKDSQVVDPVPIYLDKETEIFFWIYDGGSTSSDNRGNATLSITKIS